MQYYCHLVAASNVKRVNTGIWLENYFHMLRRIKKYSSSSIIGDVYVDVFIFFCTLWFENYKFHQNLLSLSIKAGPKVIEITSALKTRTALLQYHT